MVHLSCLDKVLRQQRVVVSKFRGETILDQGAGKVSEICERRVCSSFPPWPSVAIFSSLYKVVPILSPFHSVKSLSLNATTI